MARTPVRGLSLAALFVAMQAAAEGVTQAYHDDINVHDKKVIDGLKPGDRVIWAPRTSGSNLIVTHRQGAPNVRAQDHFDAIAKLSPTQSWRVIAHTPAGWSLTKVRDGESPQVTPELGGWRAKDAPTVSELHM